MAQTGGVVQQGGMAQTGRGGRAGRHGTHRGNGGRAGRGGMARKGGMGGKGAVDPQPGECLNFLFYCCCTCTVYVAEEQVWTIEKPCGGMAAQKVYRWLPVGE